MEIKKLVSQMTSAYNDFVKSGSDKKIMLLIIELEILTFTLL